MTGGRFDTPWNVRGNAARVTLQTYDTDQEPIASHFQGVRFCLLEVAAKRSYEKSKL